MKLKITKRNGDISATVSIKNSLSEEKILEEILQRVDRAINAAVCIAPYFSSTSQPNPPKEDMRESKSLEPEERETNPFKPIADEPKFSEFHALLRELGKTPTFHGRIVSSQAGISSVVALVSFPSINGEYEIHINGSIHYAAVGPCLGGILFPGVVKDQHRLYRITAVEITEDDFTPSNNSLTEGGREYFGVNMAKGVECWKKYSNNKKES